MNLFAPCVLDEEDMKKIEIADKYNLEIKGYENSVAETKPIKPKVIRP